MDNRHNGLTRRQWLKGAGAAGLAPLLVKTARAQSAQPAAKEGRVSTRPFGKTGVSVSILALGTMFDVVSNQLLLKQALNWGVTYWDTADCYAGGRSEEGFGTFFGRYPQRRKEVFLVTKSCGRSPQQMTELLERSLSRMKTDYIDLYFLHGISGFKEVHPDTRRWAEAAKAKRKIRFFGFSTHKNMEQCLLDAATRGYIDGIMMAYNYRLMHTDEMRRAVDACTKAGIGLTAMKTQGGGPVQQESDAELKLAGRFLKTGFTEQQARIKAVWENPQIASVCSQMPSIGVLTSNVAAALDKTRLSAVDRDLLQKHAVETASAYCAGCAHICEDAIGSAVPVSDVMRCLMYHRNYGEAGLARTAFAEIPHAARLQMTQVDYQIAEQRCPRKLPIARLMAEAVSMLA